LLYDSAAGIFAVISALAVVEGVAHIPFYGVTTGTERSSTADTTLEARFPKTTRGALSSPLVVIVHRADGFTSPVRVSITGSYLNLFTTSSVTPQPTSATTDSHATIYEFDPPDGDTLTIRWDSAARPVGWFVTQRATVALVDDDGAVRVSVQFATRLRP
jgi:hypothetical protein